MSDWAYAGPLLKSMPTNALWGVAVGIVSTAVLAYFSNDMSLGEEVAAGLLSGTSTFLGLNLYKKNQIKTMWKEREDRAAMFSRASDQVIRSRCLVRRSTYRVHSE